MIIRMPDGQQVDVSDMEQSDVVAMISASQARVDQAAQTDLENRAGVKTRAEVGRETLDEENPVMQAVIGAGRFGTEVGQGVSQMVRGVGEALGINEEGSTDEYTAGINQESDEWDQFTEGAGVEDVGYFGAMLAPALVGGGAGVGGTAALAGIESALMPTRTGSIEEKLAQATTGAVVGGAARALPDAIGAGKKLLDERKLRNIDPDVAALGVGRDVKVPADVYNPSAMKSTARDVLDTPIYSPGKKAMTDDAERVLTDMAGENVSRNTIQEAFVEGRSRLKRENSRMWDDTMEEIGDMPVEMRDVEDSLKGLMSSISREGLSGDELKQIRKLWRQRPKGDNVTLQDLHKFRAKFGNKMQGKWVRDNLDVSAPKRIYKILSDELEASAENWGGDAAVDLLKSSNKATADMYEDFATSGIPNKLARGKKRKENAFYNAATSNEPQQREVMKRIIGQEGAEAVRDRLTSDFLEVFANDGAAAAARRLKKMSKATDEFFGKDMSAELRGLQKFMDGIPKDNLKNIFKSLSISGLAGGLGVAGVGAVPSAVGYGVLAGLMRRKDMAAMLQKLSKTDAGDPLYKALTDNIKSAIGVAAGTEASKRVPEIEIRNGVNR